MNGRVATMLVGVILTVAVIAGAATMIMSTVEDYKDRLHDRTTVTQTLGDAR